MKLVFVILPLLTLISNSEAAKAAAKSTPLVIFENGRLTIQATDVALIDLLSEFQAKSGIAIELKDATAAAEWASVEFSNLPPALALRRILDSLNFAFFYSGSRLARVLILSSREGIPRSKSQSMDPNRFLSPVARPSDDAREVVVSSNALSERSKDSYLSARLDAIEALDDSDDAESIAALGNALSDREHRVREAALRVLEAKKGGEATRVMRGALNNNDPEFRALVLEALADRGDLDSLRHALADGDRDVRETAADLLWKITRPR